MNRKKYKVILKGYISEIRAFNKQEAIILAQAEAIREARDYSFVSIEEINPYTSP